MAECKGGHCLWHRPREGMACEKGDLIQIWHRGAVRGGFGPAVSQVDAAGVPASAVSARRPELVIHTSRCVDSRARECR